MRTRKGCNANAGKIAALASPAQNGRADRIDSRSWTSASGRLVGGKPFSRGALYLILPEPYLSRIRIAGNKAASSARRQTTLQREIAVKNVAVPPTACFSLTRARRGFLARRNGRASINFRVLYQLIKA